MSRQGYLVMLRQGSVMTNTLSVGTTSQSRPRSTVCGRGRYPSRGCWPDDSFRLRSTAAAEAARRPRSGPAGPSDPGATDRPWQVHAGRQQLAAEGRVGHEPGPRKAVARPAPARPPSGADRHRGPRRGVCGHRPRQLAAPLHAQGAEARRELVGLVGEPLAPRAHGASRHTGVQQRGVWRKLDTASSQHGSAYSGGAVTPSSNDEARQRARRRRRNGRSVPGERRSGGRRPPPARHEDTSRQRPSAPRTQGSSSAAREPCGRRVRTLRLRSGTPTRSPRPGD